MTVSAKTTYNGRTIGFDTDEPDKAIDGIELLESLERTCVALENIVNELKELSDNYSSEDDEEEDEDYVEDEDDEEIYDLAYEKGYDAGYSGLCCFGDNPYDRGTVAYDGWEVGYRDGIDDYEG